MDSSTSGFFPSAIAATMTKATTNKHYIDNINIAKGTQLISNPFPSPATTPTSPSNQFPSFTPQRIVARTSRHILNPCALPFTLSSVATAASVKVATMNESKQDFKSLQESLQGSLVKAVKTVNRISAEDLAFQRTVNPDVSDMLDDKSGRFLDLSTRLLKSAASACGLKAPVLEDVEDIDMRWRQVVDVVDTLLEKADTALDEYTGLIKRKDPPTTEIAPNSKRSKSTAKVIRNANISKPQTQFEIKPDNFPTGPWKPTLSMKPHARVSLDKSLVTFTTENGSQQYRHPYETEIKSMQYPKHMFQKSDPIAYKAIDGTEAIFVDTYEGVLEMLEHLKAAKEIAVDLEHHDFRTYIGLVSLMQISTRDQDWIVDTLKPWRHKLEILNEVFADPKIVKVFHGAYMDMVWLQRDLGLYVNGLFDTYFACEFLSYQARSLAFLLSKFVNFDADKQYQLADWRMRPLPQEMLYYARSDTHYLLYIFDMVRNELITASNPRSPETDLMARALERSKDVALSRHEHPTRNDETGEGVRGWYNFMLKHGHLGFDAEQFAVFRAMWKWRDMTARAEDENPNFILSSNQISEISRINPPDIKALHSLLPPVAPLVKPRLQEVWDEVQRTKAEGGPSLVQFLTSQNSGLWGMSGAPTIHKTESIMPKIDGDIVVGRMKKSQLFGDMAISSRWEESKHADSEDDAIIPYPWQRYVQNQREQESVPVAVENQTSATQQAVESAPPRPLELAEVSDQEFTLKRGKKRKATSMEEDSDSGTSSEGESSESDGNQSDAAEDVASASESDDAMLDNEENEAEDPAVDGVLNLAGDKPQRIRKQKSKAQISFRGSPKSQKGQRDMAGNGAERLLSKQQQRKLAKEKKKAEATQNKTNAPAPKYNAVPFDYSKAASVMNANRQPPMANGGKRKEAFDPYTKTADDGLKGARKAPPVKGERSGTFRK